MLQAKELKHLASEAGFPIDQVLALLPPGRKPKNEAKREFLRQLGDHLDSHPDIASNLTWQVAPANRVAPDEDTVPPAEEVKKFQDVPTQGSAGPAEPNPGTEGYPRARMMKVSDLKLSTVNAEIFSDSMTNEEKIRELAEDIRLRGIQAPLLVKRDGTVLNGNRRLLAAIDLGLKEVPVIIEHGAQSEEDELSIILRSFSANRDATIREKVNVYQAWKDELAREHGRAPGRPMENHSQDESSFWSSDQIAEEAAGRAGFRSRASAEKAAAVFKKATLEVQEKLVSGELTISGAYETIKASRKTKKASKDEGSTQGQTSADAGADKAQDTETDEGAGQAEGTTPAADAADGQADAGAAQTRDGDNVEGGDETQADQDDGDQDDEGRDDTAGGDADKADADQDRGDNHENEAADTDQGEDDGDDQDAEGDETPEPSTLKVALSVVAEFITNSPAATARELVQVLADRARLNIWIQPDSVEGSMDDLSGLVCEQVELLADEDYQAAHDWVTRHKEDLREVLSQHAPEDGNDLLGWQEPD